MAKVINVFYNAQGLPFKDKELTTHFPIVGGAFQGADNTTEIRFYVDELSANRQWCVFGKLPNGKKGFKVLTESVLDEDDDRYYPFMLSQFFTQYSGNLYLSLGGYYGNIVELNEEQEYELQQVSGEMTGAIKLQIAYSVQMEGSDYDELPQWLQALASKLDINKGIIVAPSVAYISTYVDDYENGQVFFAKNEQKLYYIDSGLVKLYSNNLGIIQTGGLYDGAILDKDIVNLPVCYIYHTNTGMIYRKISVSNGLVHFANEFSFMDGTDSQYDTLGRVTFDVNSSTGVISNSTIYTKQMYNKGQVDTQFYNKSQADTKFAKLGENNTFTGSNVFNTAPQTNDSEYGDGTGTKLTTKNYILSIKNDLESEIADINKLIPSNADETHKLISSAEKGASNGVATLDSNKKVPVSQLPDSILGQVEYCGNFDASSSQDQTIRTPRKGDYYICNTGGYHLPTGVDTSGWQTPIDFELGDWAIYDGSAWEKIDNTDAVQSVNGETGAVVLDGTKIALSNNDTTKITTKLGNIDNDIATINNKLPQVRDYVIPTTAWSLVGGKYVAELDAGVDFVIDDNAMHIYTPTSNNDQLLRDTYGINVSSDATTQKFTFTCNIGNTAPSEVINFTIAQFGGN